MSAVSLCVCYVFFLESLPPFQATGFHGDLAGYHFPLLNYAWQELREGRLPEWDPVMYCGISFAGITQEGLFYPPNWLLFGAAKLGRGMTQKSLEVLLMLHLWLGFLLCHAWLEARTGKRLAAFAGAAAFAVGGIPMAQSQHLGVVCGYAWIPMGLWGVERARLEGGVRPWLVVSLAGAMVFLAGYPPTFLAYVVCAATWALAGSRPLRNVLAVAAAVGISLLLSAVQLVPTLAANLTRMPEKSYSGGLPEGWFSYALLFLPNFHDSARPVEGVTAWGEHYYLGGTVVLGLIVLAAAALSRRTARGLEGPLLTLAVAGVLIHNPLGWIDRLVSGWPALGGVLREYNLLPCVTVSLCCLGAQGTAWLMGRSLPRPPRWAAAAVVMLAGAWCIRLGWVWIPGGVEFASGWWSLLDAAAAAALAGGLLVCIATGRLARLSAALLILLTLVELKSFGTNRRFSAEAGQPDKRYRALRDMRTGGHAMAGMEQAVFERIRADRWHRVIVLDGIQPIELHHYGLATPQGFEATLPAQYRQKVAVYTTWQTNRTFEPDPGDERFLRDFGVKYLICRSGGAGEQRVAALSTWRALGGEGFFFRVYEYARARPTYRWEGTATPLEWLPGRRSFEVASAGGGGFGLLEQNLPGWTARIDGRESAIGRWDAVFLRVEAPPGRHRIEFEYRPRDVRIGGWVSGLALGVFIGLWAYSGRFRIG